MQNSTQNALDMLYCKLLAQYVVLEDDHPELAQHVAQAKVGGLVGAGSRTRLGAGMQGTAALASV